MKLMKCEKHRQHHLVKVIILCGFMPFAIVLCSVAQSPHENFSDAAPRLVQGIGRCPKNSSTDMDKDVSNEFNYESLFIQSRPTEPVDGAEVARKDAYLQIVKKILVPNLTVDSIEVCPLDSLHQTIWWDAYYQMLRECEIKEDWNEEQECYCCTCTVDQNQLRERTILSERRRIEKAQMLLYEGDSLKVNGLLKSAAERYYDAYENLLPLLYRYVKVNEKNLFQTIQDHYLEIFSNLEMKFPLPEIHAVQGEPIDSLIFALDVTTQGTRVDGLPVSCNYKDGIIDVDTHINDGKCRFSIVKAGSESGWARFQIDSLKPLPGETDLPVAASYSVWVDLYNPNINIYVDVAPAEGGFRREIMDSLRVFASTINPEIKIIDDYKQADLLLYINISCPPGIPYQYNELKIAQYQAKIDIALKEKSSGDIVDSKTMSLKIYDKYSDDVIDQVQLATHRLKEKIDEALLTMMSAIKMDKRTETRKQMQNQMQACE